MENNKSNTFSKTTDFKYSDFIGKSHFRTPQFHQWCRELTVIRLLFHINFFFRSLIEYRVSHKCDSQIIRSYRSTCVYIRRISELQWTYGGFYLSLRFFRTRIFDFFDGSNKVTFDIKTFYSPFRLHARLYEIHFVPQWWFGVLRIYEINFKRVRSETTAASMATRSRVENTGGGSGINRVR